MYIVRMFFYGEPVYKQLGYSRVKSLNQHIDTFASILMKAIVETILI